MSPSIAGSGRSLWSVPERSATPRLTDRRRSANSAASRSSHAAKTSACVSISSSAEQLDPVADLAENEELSRSAASRGRTQAATVGAAACPS